MLKDHTAAAMPMPKITAQQQRWDCNELRTYNGELSIALGPVGLRVGISWKGVDRRAFTMTKHLWRGRRIMYPDLSQTRER